VRLVPLRLIAAAITAASLVLTTGAFAGAWPNRTIKLIVPFPPGGAADATARIFADKLSETLKQAVVIENKAGAGTAIAADVVAHAEPDGYTLSLAPTGQLALLPHLNKEIAYDPFTSFVPVSNLATVNYVLAASPDTPVASAAELIAAARQAPGKFTYSSCGTGTLCHLSGELFAGQTGTDLLHVPFKGSAQAVNALLGNVVNLSFDTVTVLAPQIRDGKVKGLLVTGRTRSPQLPDVPTAAEAGVAGYEATIWLGLMAPAGTPKPIIDKLNAAVTTAVKRPDIVKLWTDQGAVPMAMSPDQFDQFLRADIVKWAEVVKTFDKP